MPKPIAIKSANRTLQVLEYLVLRGDAASEIEVSRALGYPQSSTSTLLATLTQKGYLRRDRNTRKYSASSKIALVGAWTMRAAMGAESAVRLVEMLRRETKETITLGVRSNESIRYLRVLQPNDSICYVNPMMPRPLTHSALGRAFLAAMPVPDIAHILSSIAERNDARSKPFVMAQLFDEILECRERGYAYTEGVWLSRGGAVSMLLPKSGLAIGIGAPIERLRRGRDQFVELLQQSLTSVAAA